ncbi:type II toxin-antitoxin system RelE/ParE family toxin [Desulfurispirillum indicum]|uniref:type II toxin-antitoxin system RelE/ParE family toxin n=1 Tax=Desulfurispirillum indicum TaxID=936456 RepID=UPI001CFB23C3|nr:type II toxin-antitoxin system RelE/ParE family toxin [Desulfurispirillum indicum]UCZ57487.1 type II toxin-antitoxin system RelE/ParE family toxin [Desulfurispirillum indicum]
MLGIEWSQSASEDLMAIIDYIASESPDAAERLLELIEQSIEHLPEHPFLYKSSVRIPYAREMVVHPNYIVYYRVERDKILILAVVHSRRLFPR